MLWGHKDEPPTSWLHGHREMGLSAESFCSASVLSRPLLPETVITSQKVLPADGLGIPPCGFWSFLPPLLPHLTEHLSTQQCWVMASSELAVSLGWFFSLPGSCYKRSIPKLIWNGSLSSETLSWLFVSFDSPSPWVCSYDLDRTFPLLLSESLQSGHNSSSVLQQAKEAREGTVGERKQISSLCWKNSSSNFYILTPLTFVAAWARDSLFLCLRSGSPEWVCQEEFYTYSCSRSKTF